MVSNMEQIGEVNIPGQYGVTLDKSGDTYCVQYGAHVIDGLRTLADALREFGHCINHAARCAGAFDMEG
jgi:hypothetical protein